MADTQLLQQVETPSHLAFYPSHLRQPNSIFHSFLFLSVVTRFFHFLRFSSPHLSPLLRRRSSPWTSRRELRPFWSSFSQKTVRRNCSFVSIPSSLLVAFSKPHLPLLFPPLLLCLPRFSFLLLLARLVRVSPPLHRCLLPRMPAPLSLFPPYLRLHRLPLRRPLPLLKTRLLPCLLFCRLKINLFPMCEEPLPRLRPWRCTYR
ncbi:hypothetical protein TGVAND_435880 [Toxoplasma gondii VAND]|uniref:Uncharacterized protein n=1 Tax=Toxoplasma gondii VAND TaxID=933077 RepID=A0A086QDK4_TOXGO|nr:hypothetical protein TGVAND_435880 [Toxoplasma gondii VAND]